MNLATVIDEHHAPIVRRWSAGARRRPTASFASGSARARGGLAGLGLEPGDRMAVVCANDPGFVVAYLAGLGAGRSPCRSTPPAPRPSWRASSRAVGARLR